MAKTRDFAEVIRRKLAKDADLAAIVEQEAFNAHIATEIYTARTESNLTQTALANKIGTKQSVIARLENADYDGHSLTMLRKIAEALNKCLRVEFYAPRVFKPIAESEVKLPESSWSKTTTNWKVTDFKVIKHGHISKVS